VTAAAAPVGPGRRAVAVGGGTGLPVVLTGLLDMGFDTSAIVTMADDGGSTGVLRRELGMLPPGDVRNCLVAMAEDEELAKVFQYRFAHGEGLAGHAIGNLILAALTDIEGDFPSAIAAAGRRLRIRGHVYPSTLTDVVLHACDRSGQPLAGQALIAANPDAIAHVTLEPDAPAAYPPALAALAEADVVVMGPGSLFTSVIPNFLVGGMADALKSSSATRIYVCNVANLRGETHGLTAAEHVEALVDHGLDGAIDIVIIHAKDTITHEVCDDAGTDVEPVCVTDEQLERIAGLVGQVVVADLADSEHPARHDRERLLRVLEGVVT
jgi:uncharacterized cofD-like protein